MKGFIDQLKAALKAELELLMNEELYIDEERLSPGYRYNEASWDFPYQGATCPCEAPGRHSEH